MKEQDDCLRPQGCGDSWRSMLAGASLGVMVGGTPIGLARAGRDQEMLRNSHLQKGLRRRAIDGVDTRNATLSTTRTGS